MFGKSCGRPPGDDGIHRGAGRRRAVLKKLPAKMEDMKDIPELSYGSPREGLAEKLHMSEDLLSALNPRRHFDRPGEAIVVIDSGAEQGSEKAAKVEVDKEPADGQAVRQVERADRILPRDDRQ